MQSSAVLIRPLAPSEAFLGETGGYIGYSARVRGHLDRAAVWEAFEALRRSYPVLASRIAYDATGRAVIEEDQDFLPVVSRHDISPQEKGSDDPLLGLPDPQGRTAAVHIAQDDPDQAWVTLLTHHAIADGHHSLQLLADLWRFYADIVDGRAVWPNRHGYPRPLEELLSERGITTDTPTATDSTTPTTPVAPINLDHPRTPQPTTERIRLTIEETQALVEFGHQANTTINGLVSAALLKATADTLDVGIGDLTYQYVVDLRTRLTPSVGYTEGTNVLGMAHFTADTDADTGIATLARAVSGKLARDLAAGEIQRSALRPDEHTYISARIVSTNWGKIPPLNTPQRLTIEDFRPTIHPTNPQPTLPDRPSNIGTFYVITTFNGQLTIEPLLAPRPDATVAADRIRALLTDIPH
ncbi:phthiocerol/phthiodiolone dimycocerosyl transferase family protein [Nocardia transvalensis]|uniref:phthiocerol/phthiodiolone dimycocerosyl transferase family protein n=1 Tax=Nocardia transvalensis TaxID=37333 RepID=UPI0018946CDA|nr:hypothetical protein [Nocardia transvalensis]MBF6332212.1 hypothetical protein [Nocardia transvalensis]